MKSIGIAIGLAALLGASSASASLVYDTITGIPTASNTKLSTGSGLAPLGDQFKASNGEQIISITVQLFAAGTEGRPTDSGSVLVYLVPGVSGLPGTTSGLTLANKRYVGTILDTSLTFGSATNLTVTPASPISLTQGNWWVVLTSGSDPNNFHGSINPVDTVAKWDQQTTAIALADGAIGIPPAGNDSARPSGGVFIGDPSNVYQMQIQAPEPASLALLGGGLVIQSNKRRSRRKKATI